MSDANVVSCDHIIHVDWLKQAVLVFNDLAEAQEELGRLGASAASGVALAGINAGTGGGAGYATNQIDGSGLFWVIFPGGNPKIGTIVHEVTHAVDYLCEFTGIPVTVEAAEVRCYLVGWMTEMLVGFYGLEVKADV